MSKPKPKLSRAPLKCHGFELPVSHIEISDRFVVAVAHPCPDCGQRPLRGTHRHKKDTDEFLDAWRAAAGGDPKPARALLRKLEKLAKARSAP